MVMKCAVSKWLRISVSLVLHHTVRMRIREGIRSSGGSDVYVTERASVTTDDPLAPNFTSGSDLQVLPRPDTTTQAVSD